MTAGKDFATRVATVFAAALLVVAFSLAILYPAMMTLGELVSLVDDHALVGLRDFFHTRLPEWAWSRVAMPLLLRPAWLVPMGLGVVAGGVALTLRSHHGAPRPRRRRS